MTSKVARIVWLSAVDGGRSNPPVGGRGFRYVAPAAFGRDEAVGVDNANWSLIAEVISQSADSMEWIANVRFLVPEAPSDLLVDGARFSFFEGRRCVARGVLLPSTLNSTVLQQTVTSPQEAGHA